MVREDKTAEKKKATEEVGGVDGAEVVAGS